MVKVFKGDFIDGVSIVSPLSSVKPDPAFRKIGILPTLLKKDSLGKFLP
jgi:hypothetical protein